MSTLNSAGSRVVLVGTQNCANDREAPPIPAVESTMDDFAAALTAQAEVDADKIVRVLDAADPMRMGIAVAEAAEQATDVLFVHYVGHGFVSPDGELYLATRATDPRTNLLEHNSVRYATIRRSLLNSRASAIVVILDCCFSGRAIDTLSTSQPIDLAEVRGGYVLTSAAREQVALAPTGQPHTAFTGELIQLLRDGDSQAPPELSMDAIYRALDRKLPARGLPRPHKRGSERLDDLVLVRNVAHDTSPEPSAESAATASGNGTGDAEPPSAEADSSATPPSANDEDSTKTPAASEGSGATPRKRGRLMSLLVMIIALFLVGTGAGTATWFLKQRSVHSGAPDQGGAKPGHSAQDSPGGFAQTPPNLPPPTECARRSPVDDCGELPAGVTSRTADGALVSLVGSSNGTILRYKQATARAPVDDKTNLGGNVAAHPVVVPDARGRLLGFAIGNDGILRYNENVEAGSHAWTQIAPMRDLRGIPAVAQDAQGELVVVTRDANGTLWRIPQSGAGGNGWNRPERIPGPPLKDDPIVHLDRNKSLRVFALGTDDLLHTWAQRQADDTDWRHQLVGGTTHLATSPTVALDGNGQLHLFARGMDGNLQHITENAKAPNAWPGQWTTTGPPGPYAGKPLSGTDSFGTVTAFIRRQDESDQLMYASAGGSRSNTGKSAPIQQPMSDVLSVTLDRENNLVVQGVHDREVVSAFRAPED